LLLRWFKKLDRIAVRVFNLNLPSDMQSMAHWCSGELDGPRTAQGLYRDLIARVVLELSTVEVMPIPERVTVAMIVPVSLVSVVRPTRGAGIVHLPGTVRDGDGSDEAPQSRLTICSNR
jgi:hypothetical protein